MAVAVPSSVALWHRCPFIKDYIKYQVLYYLPILLTSNSVKLYETVPLSNCTLTPSHYLDLDLNGKRPVICHWQFAKKFKAKDIYFDNLSGKCFFFFMEQEKIFSKYSGP